MSLRDLSPRKMLLCIGGLALLLVILVVAAPGGKPPVSHAHGATKERFVGTTTVAQVTVQSVPQETVPYGASESTGTMATTTTIPSHAATTHQGASPLGNTDDPSAEKQLGQDEAQWPVLSALPIFSENVNITLGNFSGPGGQPGLMVYYFGQLSQAEGQVKLVFRVHHDLESRYDIQYSKTGG